MNDERTTDLGWVDYLPSFIRIQLRKRKGLQAILGNIAWLSFDKVLRMGVGLFVGVWIARALGPENFGVMNYAVAVASILGGISNLSLNAILTREIIKRPQDRYSLIGTAFFLKLFVAALILLITFSAAYFSDSDHVIKAAVLIMSATILFESFDVIKLWFDSQIKSKYVGISQGVTFILMAALKIVLLLLGAPLLWFMWSMFFEVFLGVLGAFFYYHYKGEAFSAWNFRLDEARLMLQESWPYLLSTIATLAYMRISQIMLGSMLSEREVGIYSAAIKISEVWYFIPTAVLTSLYPRFIQIYHSDERVYTDRLMLVMGGFFWFSLALAVAVTLLSKLIVSALYGAQYHESAAVLSISIFSGISVSMNTIISQRFILKKQQKIALYGALTGAVSAISLNMLLIPGYAAAGAAMATLISCIVPTVFVSLFFDRSIGSIFVKSVYVPFSGGLIAKARNVLSGTA